MIRRKQAAVWLRLRWRPHIYRRGSCHRSPATDASGRSIRDFPTTVRTRDEGHRSMLADVWREGVSLVHPGLVSSALESPPSDVRRCSCLPRTRPILNAPLKSNTPRPRRAPPRAYPTLCHRIEGALSPVDDQTEYIRVNPVPTIKNHLIHVSVSHMVSMQRKP